MYSKGTQANKTYLGVFKMAIERVYANGLVFVTQAVHPALYDEYNSLMSMAGLFGETPEFKAGYKEFAGRVRALLGVTDMLSFSKAESVEGEQGFACVLYPVPYTSALVCSLGSDEERGLYLEFEKEEV